MTQPPLQSHLTLFDSPLYKRSIGYTPSKLSLPIVWPSNQSISMHANHCHKTRSQHSIKRCSHRFQISVAQTRLQREVIVHNPLNLDHCCRVVGRLPANNMNNKLLAVRVGHMNQSNLMVTFIPDESHQYCLNKVMRSTSPKHHTRIQYLASGQLVN